MAGFDSVKYFLQLSGVDYCSKNAAQAAMNTWNSVKVLGSSKSITNMSVASDDSQFNQISFKSVGTAYVGRTNYNEYEYISGDAIYTVQIYLNSDYQWSTSGEANKFDIRTVVLHELGHALGVAHCHEKDETQPCWSATCLDNVMNPYVYKGVMNYDLQPYDSSSLQMIYQN